MIEYKINLNSMLNLVIIIIVSSMGYIGHNINNNIDHLRGEINNIRNDMNSEIGTVRGEIGTVRGEIHNVRTEMRQEIHSLREDMRANQIKIETKLDLIISAVNKNAVDIATLKEQMRTHTH